MRGSQAGCPHLAVFSSHPLHPQPNGWAPNPLSTSGGFPPQKANMSCNSFGLYGTHTRPPARPRLPSPYCPDGAFSPKGGGGRVATPAPHRPPWYSQYTHVSRQLGPLERIQCGQNFNTDHLYQSPPPRASQKKWEWGEHGRAEALSIRAADACMETKVTMMNRKALIKSRFTGFVQTCGPSGCSHV